MRLVLRVGRAADDFLFTSNVLMRGSRAGRRSSVADDRSNAARLSVSATVVPRPQFLSRAVAFIEESDSGRLRAVFRVGSPRLFESRAPTAR